MNEIDKDSLEAWDRWRKRQGPSAPSPIERQVEALERIALALEKLSSEAAIAYFGTLTSSSVNMPVEKIKGTPTPIDLDIDFEIDEWEA